VQQSSSRDLVLSRLGGIGRYLKMLFSRQNFFDRLCLKVSKGPSVEFLVPVVETQNVRHSTVVACPFPSWRIKNAKRGRTTELILPF
jgi:hypothetical protein